MGTDPIRWSTVFSWVSVLLLDDPENHSGSSRAIIYNVCSVYRERGGVFSTSAGYDGYNGGYHEYIGGCSVHQRVTMMQVGGYYDSCERIS